MSSLKRKTQEVDYSANPPSKRHSLETMQEDLEDIMNASPDELLSQTNARNDEEDSSIGIGEELRGRIAIPIS